LNGCKIVAYDNVANKRIQNLKERRHCSLHAFNYTQKSTAQVKNRNGGSKLTENGRTGKIFISVAKQNTRDQFKADEEKK
jgi:hypothetical protein